MGAGEPKPWLEVGLRTTSGGGMPSLPVGGGVHGELASLIIEWSSHVQREYDALVGRWRIVESGDLVNMPELRGLVNRRMSDEEHQSGEEV